MNTTAGHPSHKFVEPEIRGDLKKREYEIYCPLMEGAPYKNNYYHSSCCLRIEDGSCKKKDCEYRL